MPHTYKALAILLSYPEAPVREAVPAAMEIVRSEALLPEKLQRALTRLADELSSGDPYALKENYVQLFDRTRSLSLNLYEHVHGESRERGPAMVALRELYLAEGLELESSELPDNLPVFLEFLSLLPAERSASLLGEAVHVIEALGERLRRRSSPYRAVFGALAALAGEKADQDALRALLDEPDDDPDDLEAVDRAWEETPVSFGPESFVSGNADGCPKAAAMVQHMKQGA